MPSLSPHFAMFCSIAAVLRGYEDDGSPAVRGLCFSFVAIPVQLACVKPLRRWWPFRMARMMSLNNSVWRTEGTGADELYGCGAADHPQHVEDVRHPAGVAVRAGAVHQSAPGLRLHAVDRRVGTRDGRPGERSRYHASATDAANCAAARGCATCSRGIAAFAHGLLCHSGSEP